MSLDSAEKCKSAAMLGVVRKYKHQIHFNSYLPQK